MSLTNESPRKFRHPASSSARAGMNFKGSVAKRRRTNRLASGAIGVECRVADALAGSATGMEGGVADLGRVGSVWMETRIADARGGAVWPKSRVADGLIGRAVGAEGGVADFLIGRTRLGIPIRISLGLADGERRKN